MKKETPLYKINGITYQTCSEPISMGDLILDIRDNSHGTCDFIFPDGKTLAMNDHGVVEVGVPIKKCLKLVEHTMQALQV